MPNQAQNGYAFEYAIIVSIPEAVDDWIANHREGTRNFRIIEDDAFLNIQESFQLTDPPLQEIMLQAARAGLRIVLDMEPRIIHASVEDPILISSNPATRGITGDVRDIILIRQLNPSRRRSIILSPDNVDQHWEIGISAKWNNDVIKNSRLAEHLDFCQSWFGFPCSQQYWDEILAPMQYIHDHDGRMWRDLPNKREKVYLSMIMAFIDEINHQSRLHPNLPQLLVEYLIGRYDFYKLMTVKANRITNIQAFNLHGNLNQDCSGIPPLISIPHQSNQRPTRIVTIDRFRDRESWVEIILDNGWQFTLRLHNAESEIAPTLKFDIRFLGNPLNTWSEHWV
jgi:hypothetical protein